MGFHAQKRNGKVSFISCTFDLILTVCPPSGHVDSFRSCVQLKFTLELKDQKVPASLSVAAEVSKF